MSVCGSPAALPVRLILWMRSFVGWRVALVLDPLHLLRKRLPTARHVFIGSP
jgi:hypothetical protein